MRWRGLLLTGLSRLENTHLPTWICREPQCLLGRRWWCGFLWKCFTTLFVVSCSLGSPAKLVQFRAEQSPVAARLTQGWQHAGRSGFAIVAFPSSRQKAGLITWSTYGCCGEDVLRNRTPNFRPLSLAPYFGHHLRLVTHSLLVEVVQLRLRDGGKPVVESGRHMSSRYDTN